MVERELVRDGAGKGERGGWEKQNGKIDDGWGRWQEKKGDGSEGMREKGRR